MGTLISFHKPGYPGALPGVNAGVDVVGGREGRQAGKQGQLWSLELGDPESLGLAQVSFRTGEGAGFSKSRLTPLSPHPDSWGRSEYPNRTARLEHSEDLCLTGDCVVWWVVLAVDSTHSLPIVSGCLGRILLDPLYVAVSSSHSAKLEISQACL